MQGVENWVLSEAFHRCHHRRLHPWPPHRACRRSGFPRLRDGRDIRLFCPDLRDQYGRRVHVHVHRSISLQHRIHIYVYTCIN